MNLYNCPFGEKGSYLPPAKHSASVSQRRTGVRHPSLVLIIRRRPVLGDWFNDVRPKPFFDFHVLELVHFRPHAIKCGFELLWLWALIYPVLGDLNLGNVRIPPSLMASEHSSDRLVVTFWPAEQYSFRPYWHVFFLECIFLVIQVLIDDADVLGIFGSLPVRLWLFILCIGNILVNNCSSLVVFITHHSDFLCSVKAHSPITVG